MNIKQYCKKRIFLNLNHILDYHQTSLTAKAGYISPCSDPLQPPVPLNWGHTAQYDLQDLVYSPTLLPRVSKDLCRNRCDFFPWDCHLWAFPMVPPLSGLLHSSSIYLSISLHYLHLRPNVATSIKFSLRLLTGCDQACLKASILASVIPWTEDPGRLHSTGSHSDMT